MNIDMQKYARAKKATLLGIAIDGLLVLLKMAAGIIGNSAVLIADAVHSFSDMFSSLIIYIALKIATKEADKEHPYGHGRAEVIAGNIVSFFLVCMAAGIGYAAVRRMRSTFLGPPGVVALIAAFVGMVVKEAFYRYKKSVGEKVGSISLMADAWHHRSDAFSSACALIGAGGAYFLGSRFNILDPIAAAVVALIVVGAGVRLFIESTQKLMDVQGPEELVSRIRETVLSIHDVLGVEKLRVRKAGLEYLVDIHVEVDKDMSVKKSHEVSQQVRRKVLANLKEVRDLLVHIEPYFPGDH